MRALISGGSEGVAAGVEDGVAAVDVGAAGVPLVEQAALARTTLAVTATATRDRIVSTGLANAVKEL
jgi:hypothetical protein